MQGQQSAIGSLTETLDFCSTSTSSDGGIDQQICWNNQLPDYVVSSNETNISVLNPASQERQNLGWSLGESSSTSAQNHVGGQIERKTDHGWSSTMSACPGPSHSFDQHHYGSPNILSLSDVDVNLNDVQMANSNFFSQGSSSTTLPRDLNTNSGFEGHDGNEDDCQIMECTPAYKSDGLHNERMSSANTSSHPFAGTNGYLMDGTDGRPGCSSLDGRRLSCKRKTLEGHLGQSSASGSTHYVPNAGNGLWHSVPSPHNTNTGAIISAPTQSSRSVNLSDHQLNPRLRLTMGGAVSESPLGLPASGIGESSPHSTFRLRVNSSHQQVPVPGNLFPVVGDVGNANVSSDWHSSRIFHNPSNFPSMSAADIVDPQGQPLVLHVPSPHLSAQARWPLAPNSRTSSSSNFSVPGERDTEPSQEPHSRSAPRNISQHPMFIPATDLRNLNPNPDNWTLAGGNISIVGSVASASRSGSNSRPHSASPTWVPLHRNTPQYPRRLSEFVRRSLLSSADAEPRGRSSNSPPLRLSSAASRARELSGNHGHRPSRPRSTLLGRHLDGAIGVPHSWRTLTGATEGRSRLVSEIHSVLDLMRRREGIRLEDVMMLDQSVFFGVAEIHDRHRDMRVDVDNMSYEELLALEERIGNVCTGLSEEIILNRLKQRKYIRIKTEQPIDAEPCCICQEEYNDGEDLGTLECGHDFHADCVKQWLKHKNLCPICKTTGLMNT